MKKNIALLISIIALIFLIFTLRVTINKDNNNPKLNGNVISEGIYGYDLETENLSVNGLTSKNNEIYYLLMDVIDEYNGIYNYKLKKINVYKNELEYIYVKEDKNSIYIRELADIRSDIRAQYSPMPLKAALSSLLKIVTTQSMLLDKILF